MKTINLSELLNLKKIVAVIVVNCFLFSFVCAPAVSEVIAGINAADQYKQIFKDFILPYSYGKITKAHYAGTDRVVINIQDLHCHPKVQKNISNIIDLFDKQYGVNNVYLEGAYGDVDTAWLTEKLDNKIKDNVLDKLVETGKLTGVEYYSALTGRNEIIKGLENKEPYLDNLKRFGNILESQNHINIILKGIEKSTKELKKKYYTKRQYKIEKLSKDYIAGKITSEKYYTLLSKHIDRLGIDLYKYENTLTYIMLLSLQKELNYTEITKELQSFVYLLKEQLPFSAYKMLLDGTGNFKYTDKLYEYIVRISKIYNLDLTVNFKELNKYFNYIELSQKINPLELITEEDALTKEINTRFSDTKAQRDVVFITHFEKYLKDYLMSKITSDDYEYYKANIEKYKRLWNRYADNRVLSLLDEYIKEADRFYEINNDRNTYFTDNMFNGVDTEKIESEKISGRDINNIIDNMKSVKRIDVVLTGGFHSGTVGKILESQDVSYIVITPNVSGGVKEAEKTYYQIAKEQRKFLFQTLATLPVSLYGKDARIRVSVKSFGEEISRQIFGEEEVNRVLQKYSDAAEDEMIDELSLKAQERQVQLAEVLNSDDTGNIKQAIIDIIKNAVSEDLKDKISEDLLEKINTEKLSDILDNSEELNKIVGLLSEKSNLKKSLNIILDGIENLAGYFSELINFDTSSAETNTDSIVSQFINYELKDILSAVISLADVKAGKITGDILAVHSLSKLSTYKKLKNFFAENKSIALMLSQVFHNKGYYEPLKEGIESKTSLTVDTRLFDESYVADNETPEQAKERAEFLLGYLNNNLADAIKNRRNPNKSYKIKISDLNTVDTESLKLFFEKAGKLLSDSQIEQAVSSDALIGNTLQVPWEYLTADAEKYGTEEAVAQRQQFLIDKQIDGAIVTISVISHAQQLGKSNNPSDVEKSKDLRYILSLIHAGWSANNSWSDLAFLKYPGTEQEEVLTEEDGFLSTKEIKKDWEYFKAVADLLSLSKDDSVIASLISEGEKKYSSVSEESIHKIDNSQRKNILDFFAGQIQSVINSMKSLSDIKFGEITKEVLEKHSLQKLDIYKSIKNLLNSDKKSALMLSRVFHNKGYYEPLKEGIESKTGLTVDTRLFDESYVADNETPEQAKERAEFLLRYLNNDLADAIKNRRNPNKSYKIKISDLNTADTDKIKKFFVKAGKNLTAEQIEQAKASDSVIGNTLQVPWEYLTADAEKYGTEEAVAQRQQFLIDKQIDGVIVVMTSIIYAMQNWDNEETLKQMSAEGNTENIKYILSLIHAGWSANNSWSDLAFLKYPEILGQQDKEGVLTYEEVLKDGEYFESVAKALQLTDNPVIKNLLIQWNTVKSVSDSDLVSADNESVSDKKYVKSVSKDKPVSKIRKKILNLFLPLVIMTSLIMPVMHQTVRASESETSQIVQSVDLNESDNYSETELTSEYLWNYLADNNTMFRPVSKKDLAKSLSLSKSSKAKSLVNKIFSDLEKSGFDISDKPNIIFMQGSQASLFSACACTDINTIIIPIDKEFPERSKIIAAIVHEWTHIKNAPDVASGKMSRLEDEARAVEAGYIVDQTFGHNIVIKSRFNKKISVNHVSGMEIFAFYAILDNKDMIEKKFRELTKDKTVNFNDIYYSDKLYSPVNKIGIPDEYTYKGATKKELVVELFYGDYKIFVIVDTGININGNYSEDSPKQIKYSPSLRIEVPENTLQTAETEERLSNIGSKIYANDDSKAKNFRFTPLGVAAGVFFEMLELWKPDFVSQHKNPTAQRKTATFAIRTLSVFAGVLAALSPLSVFAIPFAVLVTEFITHFIYNETEIKKSSENILAELSKYEDGDEKFVIVERPDGNRYVIKLVHNGRYHMMNIVNINGKTIEETFDNLETTETISEMFGIDMKIKEHGKWKDITRITSKYYANKLKITTGKNFVPGTTVSLVSSLDKDYDIRTAPLKNAGTINDKDFTSIEKLSDTSGYEEIYLEDFDESNPGEFEKIIKDCIDNNKLFVIYPVRNNVDTENMSSEELFKMYNFLLNKFGHFSRLLSKILIYNYGLKTTTNFFFNEILKNAFIHGNNVQAHLPVYMNISKAGINIYNEVKAQTEENVRNKFIFSATGGSGYGVGIKTMQYKQNAENMTDEDKHILLIKYTISGYTDNLEMLSYDSDPSVQADGKTFYKASVKIDPKAFKSAEEITEISDSEDSLLKKSDKNETVQSAVQEHESGIIADSVMPSVKNAVNPVNAAQEIAINIIVSDKGIIELERNIENISIDEILVVAGSKAEAEKLKKQGIKAVTVQHLLGRSGSQIGEYNDITVRAKWNKDKTEILLFTKKETGTGKDELLQILSEAITSGNKNEVFDGIKQLVIANEDTFAGAVNAVKNNYTYSVTMPDKELKFDLTKTKIKDIKSICDGEFKSTGTQTFVITSHQAAAFADEIMSLKQEKGFRFIVAYKNSKEYGSVDLDGAKIDASDITDFETAERLLKKVKTSALEIGVGLSVSVKFNDSIYSEFTERGIDIFNEYGVVPVVDAGSQYIASRSLGKTEAENLTEQNIDIILENDSIISIVIDDSKLLSDRKDKIKETKNKGQKYNKGYNASLSSKFDYRITDINMLTKLKGTEKSEELKALEELLLTDVTVTDKNMKEIFDSLSLEIFSSDAQSYLKYLLEREKYEEAAGFIRGTVMNSAREEIITELAKRNIDINIDKFKSDADGKYQKALLTLAVQLAIEGQNITELLNTDFIDSDTITAKDFLDSIKVKINGNMEDILKNNEFKITKLSDVAKAISDFKEFNVLLQDRFTAVGVSAEVKISALAVKSILSAA